VQTIAYIKEPTALEYGTFDIYSTSSTVLAHFAPSEVGLSLGRQNLDHNSTNSTLRQIPSCSINKKNLHPEHIKETKYFWRQIASWATQLSQQSMSKAQT
jgi:hypothetical protein